MTRSQESSTRIVVWNANMAVHRKLRALVDKLHPDIAVVPECAAQNIVRKKGGPLLPGFSMVWVGRDPNKGLAVFAFGDYKVALDESYDSRLEWIAPVDVQGPAAFHLLAVWASNRRAETQHPEHARIPQPVAALSVYRDWLTGHSVVVAGDFNHNVIWDRPGRERNHANTIQACADAGLVSAYHEWSGETAGAETIPTLYWRDRTEIGRRFHIDYLFIPNAWRPLLRNVAIGSFAEWVGSGLSDHVPVVIDLALA